MACVREADEITAKLLKLGQGKSQGDRAHHVAKPNLDKPLTAIDQMRRSASNLTSPELPPPPATSGGWSRKPSTYGGAVMKACDRDVLAMLLFVSVVFGATIGAAGVWLNGKLNHRIRRARSRGFRPRSAS
jgi:hypothetical protein